MDKYTADHASPKDQKAYDASMRQQLEECIRLCLNCARACTETLAYCHGMGGDHVQPEHLRLLLDCEEICQLSAHYMLRGSEFHAQACGVCAQVCERCAEDCEQFLDDATMESCAELCSSCAESCMQMARMA
ncbi:MAG: four-helix bundle copper-binding protein [Gammaproteobacteria bacterium]